MLQNKETSCRGQNFAVLQNHKYSPTQLSLHGVGSQLIASSCPVLLSSDGQRNLQYWHAFETSCIWDYCAMTL